MAPPQAQPLELLPTPPHPPLGLQGRLLGIRDVFTPAVAAVAVGLSAACDPAVAANAQRIYDELARCAHACVCVCVCGVRVPVRACVRGLGCVCVDVCVTCVCVCVRLCASMPMACARAFGVQSSQRLWLCGAQALVPPRCCTRCCYSSLRFAAWGGCTQAASLKTRPAPPPSPAQMHPILHPRVPTPPPTPLTPPAWAAWLVLAAPSREEGMFVATLERGQKQLDELLAAAKAPTSSSAASSSSSSSATATSSPPSATSAASPAAPPSISGSDAFMLYDTFGFPLELTQELAEAQGVEVGVGVG